MDGASWREATGVVDEVNIVHALKLDAEISRAAIVLWIKAIRFAAGSRADANHVYANALQAVDDGLTRRASATASNYEHATQVQGG